GVHAGIAEPDDVGTTVTREISQEARMRVHPPSVVDTEIRQHELRCLKGAVAIAQRHVHTGITETNAVGAPIAREITQEPRMRVDAPALVVAEVRHRELRRLKAAVAIAQRHIHTGITEADDVGPTVARDITEQTHMSVDMPTTRFGTEVGDDRHRRERE